MAKYEKIIHKDYTTNTNEYETILGIPMTEALKVLTLYKELHPKSMSKDFVRGFEAGYNRAYDEFEQSMHDCINDIIEP